MSIVIPEEEVIANIRDMGYITVQPRREYPSYYKLADGTIIRASVQVHAVIPSPTNPEDSTVISTNIINAFVPKEGRNPTAFQPMSEPIASSIVDEDVDYEVMREQFSVYDLSDGKVLSVKTVVGQINKTKYWTRGGEPVYTVNANPIIKVKRK